MDTHYSQSVESQGQKKKDLESSKREAAHHVQGILNKINSRFLIRSHGGQREYNIFLMKKNKKITVSQ